MNQKRYERAKQAALIWLQGTAPDHDPTTTTSFYEGVNWADKHPDWISTGDRLPEVGQRVIVCTKTGTVTLATLHYYNNCYLFGGFRHHMEVTHWLPLPTPPRY
jgi:hypothetical protein